MNLSEKIVFHLKEARSHLPASDEELDKWVLNGINTDPELFCDQEEWEFYSLLDEGEYELAWQELKNVADLYFKPPLMDSKFWKAMAIAAGLMLENDYLKS